ncbi:MAG: VacJ family lipoprotein [Pseudomonadota bacterium]|nr:VacJ family lipoprotein [Pseudomonadota bacterium]
MCRKTIIAFVLLFCFFSISALLTPSVGQADSTVAEVTAEPDEYAEYDEEVGDLYDPWEPMNRSIFTFNDRLHLWIIEPTSSGYEKVTPSILRSGLRNFFNNLLEPTRIINCLLQGRFQDAEETFLRFALNTTAGVGGIMDPGTYEELKSHKGQFFQTFAKYGVSSGPFLVLPFFGPSDIRGTVGLVGDAVVSPLFFALYDKPEVALAVQSVYTINQTSFKLGEYEKLLSGALDPYVAVRDAYVQNQQEMLEK